LIVESVASSIVALLQQVAASPVLQELVPKEAWMLPDTSRFQANGDGNSGVI
jgi:hypothetical protein